MVPDNDMEETTDHVVASLYRHHLFAARHLSELACQLEDDNRGTSDEEVIERHSSRIYRVYMLGFVPGFAYMGRVDARIAAPRRRVPRDRVPAGSVGIAGEQTGVYPIVTPGGWQLIGRTDTVMFDAARPRPSLLQPGDEVRFVPLRHVA